MQQKQQPTQQHTQNLVSQSLSQEDKTKIKNVVQTAGEKEKELREMLQKKKQNLLFSLEERDRMLSRIDGNSIIADSAPDGLAGKMINNEGKDNDNRNMKNDGGKGGEEEDDDTVYENKNGNDQYQRLDQICDDEEEEEEEEEEDEEEHSLNVSNTSDVTSPFLNLASYIPTDTSSAPPSSHPPSIFNLHTSLHTTSNFGVTENSRVPIPTLHQSLPSEAVHNNATTISYGNRNSDSLPSFSPSFSSPSIPSTTTASSTSFSSSFIPSSSSSKGTCEAMCPYEERKQRIEESDVHRLEHPLSA